MFKSIITAAVVATISTHANAIPVNQCVTVGHFVEVMAKGRDAGINATEMYYMLSNQNLPEAITTNLLNLVYLDGKEVGGAELNRVFVKTCVGESL